LLPSEPPGNRLISSSFPNQKRTGIHPVFPDEYELLVTIQRMARPVSVTESGLLIFGCLTNAAGIFYLSLL
jgi:hypothetical protein